MARKSAVTTARTTRQGARRLRHERAVAYLDALLEDAGREELAAILGRIAQHAGGARLAEKVELSAGTLYRTLCRRGNPELEITVALLKAMGMRLALRPLGALRQVRGA